MIIGEEKLKSCDNKVKLLVTFLESLYSVVTVTSGYRTEDENKKVGGSTTSAHVLGLGVDIVIENVSPIKVIAKVLDNLSKVPGIKGIGIDVFRNMAHFDFKDRGKKFITYWPYDRNGRYV